MAKRRTSDENEDQDELEYEETLSKRARVEEREDADSEEPMVFEDALPRKTAGVRSFTLISIGHSCRKP